MPEQHEPARKAELSDKPKNLWDGALKIVRGENTAQLIENFTAEMTLVAEGLCEDQNNLRRETERAAAEEDRRIQKLQSRIDSAEAAMEQERANYDRDLTELRTRIASLEKKANEKGSRAKKDKGNIIHDLTILVGVAGGAWIIVTLLTKLL